MHLQTESLLLFFPPSFAVTFSCNRFRLRSEFFDIYHLFPGVYPEIVQLEKELFRKSYTIRKKKSDEPGMRRIGLKWKRGKVSLDYFLIKTDNVCRE